MFRRRAVASISRQVSASHVAEILLVGDKIDATTAYRMGLVNRVIPTDQVLKSLVSLRP